MGAASLSSRPIVNSPANSVVTKGSSIGKVFRAVRHVHQSRERFRCDLYIEKLSLRVPSPKKVCVEWMRGPNSVKSAHAPTLHKNVWTCSWPSPLSLSATLFSSASGRNEKKYAPKETIIRFLEFSSARTKNPERLGEVVLDLADIVANPAKYAHVTRPLTRSLDPSARLTFRLTCTSLTGEAASEMSDASSLPDSEHGGGRLFRRRQSLRNMLRGRAEPDSSPSQQTVRGDASPLNSDPDSNELLRTVSPAATYRRGSVEFASAPPVAAKKPNSGRALMLQSGDARLKTLNEADFEDSTTDRYQSLRKEFERLKEQHARIQAADKLEFDLRLQTATEEHAKAVRDLEGRQAKVIMTLDRLLISNGITDDLPSVEAKLAALEQYFAGVKTALEQSRSPGQDLVKKLEASESANRDIVTRTDEERRVLQEELRSQQQAHKALKKQLESVTARFELEKQHYCEQVTALQEQLASLQGQPSINMSDSPVSSLSHLTKTELIAKLQRYEQAANLSDVPKTVADLEEQLICAKVQLAQAETEKEELLERARKRIDDLKETARWYAAELADMEKRLSELKVQHTRPQRVPSSVESVGSSTDTRWAAQAAAAKKLMRTATTALRRGHKSSSQTLVASEDST